VSGNDQTAAILGYSTNGNIDLDNIPDNVRYWLESYAEQLKAIDDGTPVATSRARTRGIRENIEPLLSTTWNQDEPYNLMCPDGDYKEWNANDYDASNRCVTGCVATALAQVMYYHKWPLEQTTAIPQYTINYTNGTSFTLNELSATTFEWNKMKPSYSKTETDDAAYAVAKLMRYVGQACQMAYGTGASSAYIHTDMMISAFGYSKNIHTKYRDGYTTTQWENMVYDELASSRPVLYSGQTGSGSGHQFVCDGFLDGLFHLNWGWGGDLNGYFVLSIADPNGQQGIGGSTKAYKIGQDAVFNFMPAATIEEEKPMLTSNIGSNTATTNYTRNSASDDFTGISISYNYIAQYSYQPSTIYNAEIGWGLYQGEQLIKCVGSFTKNIDYRNVPAGLYYIGWMNSLSNASFGAGLPDGKYQLQQIWRKANSNDAWTLMDNYGTDYLVAEISENSLTVRTRNTSSTKFSVNSISVPETMIEGEPVAVTVNITNEGETNQETVCLWLQEEGSSDWTKVASLNGYVGPGETGDVVMTFTPQAGGSFNLKVTNNESDVALATMDKITIFDVFQTTVDGLKYSCITGLNVATVIAGEYQAMESVEIPATITDNGVVYAVKAIGDYAFSGNSSLKSISFPEGLKTIGSNAFYYCPQIEKAILPEGLETLGESAFEYCFELVNLVLPSTLSSIGQFVISNCSALASVVSHIQDPLQIDDNTFTFRNWNNATQKYDISLSSATLFVPIGAKEAYQAIKGWTAFKAIEEGEILETTVDGLNYKYYTGSKEATVIAGDYSELTSVVIPESVTIDNVDYIVKAIGPKAFYYCQNIEDISLPDGLETIGDEAFMGNYKMNAFTIPSHLKSIGNYAFYNLYAFKKAILPEGLESIGAYAFAYCYVMNTLVLPSTLKSIGQCVINGCTSLDIVESHIAEPIQIDDQTFVTRKWNSNTSQYDITPSIATLYVPGGKKEAYEAITGWAVFQGGIKEIGDTDGNGTITASDAMDILKYILGETPEGFDKIAADMNGDGVVTVTDIILMMIACRLIP
jgi:hypothetical protein